MDIIISTGCTEGGKLIGYFVSENVINLLKRCLSKAEVGLLSRGLNFLPTPSDLDKSKLREDIESFKTRMRLNLFFSDRDECEENVVYIFHYCTKNRKNVFHILLYVKRMFPLFRAIVKFCRKQTDYSHTHTVGSPIYDKIRHCEKISADNSSGGRN